MLEIIQLVPYPYHIACVFTKKQHDALCKQLNLEPFGDWSLPTEQQAVASCQFYRRTQHPRAFAIMSFYVDAHDFDLVSAAHEGVHVMSDLMMRVGLTYTPENDEWYTYCLENIMYNVRRKYKELEWTCLICGKTHIGNSCPEEPTK